ncbi:RRQRL motif-containing zinc-binding protein [Streptomyces sp. NPDC046876]|uniref:RRQRL motif-containing zinc-binding protein n=1 Tax=Streptomyces sp. NPDC046876 TaxID=3155616 RepID=UPI0034065A91
MPCPVEGVRSDRVKVQLVWPGAICGESGDPDPTWAGSVGSFGSVRAAATGAVLPPWQRLQAEGVIRVDNDRVAVAGRDYEAFLGGHERSTRIARYWVVLVFLPDERCSPRLGLDRIVTLRHSRRRLACSLGSSTVEVRDDRKVGQNRQVRRERDAALGAVEDRHGTRCSRRSIGSAPQLASATHRCRQRTRLYDDISDCPNVRVHRLTLHDSTHSPALCPGGQEPVARIECRRGRPCAWLYRIDLAKPKLPMALAKEAALDKAMAARQTCPGPCGRRCYVGLPLWTLGSCLECYDGTPAVPATYPASPAKHSLAA